MYKMTAMLNSDRYCLLVVDDEPLALRLVRRVFETESDIEVHLTTSTTDALELLRMREIDLVISDQRMPELSGLQLLARVRELRPRALRMLLTGLCDTSVALQPIDDGLVYKFVPKPWDPDDMRIMVRRACETKRLADENERRCVASGLS